MTTNMTEQQTVPGTEVEEQGPAASGSVRPRVVVLGGRLRARARHGPVPALPPPGIVWLHAALQAEIGGEPGCGRRIVAEDAQEQIVDDAGRPVPAGPRHHPAQPSSI